MMYVYMCVCGEGVPRQNEKLWAGLPGMIKMYFLPAFCFFGCFFKKSQKKISVDVM